MTSSLTLVWSMTSCNKGGTYLFLLRPADAIWMESMALEICDCTEFCASKNDEVKVL
jgi:hypothetical protein